MTAKLQEIKTCTTEKIGVVIERDGLYWNEDYYGGHGGGYYRYFGALETATVHDPKYCKKPADAMPKGCENDVLGAVLRTVRITTVHEVAYISEDYD